MVKDKVFFLRSGIKQGCPLSHVFNTVLEVLSRATRQEKEIKGIQIGKEEVKPPLSADDMIMKNKKSYRIHEKSIRINEFSNVAGYKINMQKSTEFLFNRTIQKWN